MTLLGGDNSNSTATTANLPSNEDVLKVMKKDTCTSLPEVPS